MNRLIFSAKFPSAVLGGTAMIKISDDRKSPIFPTGFSAESASKKGLMPLSFKMAILLSEVVEPLTENPFSAKDFPKGRPNQPQPRMLISRIGIRNGVGSGYRQRYGCSCRRRNAYQYRSGHRPDFLLDDDGIIEYKRRRHHAGAAFFHFE